MTIKMAAKFYALDVYWVSSSMQTNWNASAWFLAKDNGQMISSFWRSRIWHALSLHKLDPKWRNVAIYVPNSHCSLDRIQNRVYTVMWVHTSSSRPPPLSYIGNSTTLSLFPWEIFRHLHLEHTMLSLIVKTNFNSYSLKKNLLCEIDPRLDDPLNITSQGVYRMKKF